MLTVLLFDDVDQFLKTLPVFVQRPDQLVSGQPKRVCDVFHAQRPGLIEVLQYRPGGLCGNAASVLLVLTPLHVLIVDLLQGRIEGGYRMVGVSTLEG